MNGEGKLSDLLQCCALVGGSGNVASEENDEGAVDSKSIK
jgi:hypothetical protein